LPGEIGQHHQAALDKQGRGEICPIGKYSRLKPNEIAPLAAEIRKYLVEVGKSPVLSGIKKISREQNCYVEALLPQKSMFMNYAG